MSKRIAWTVAVLLGICSFGIGNALGQLQRLTGSPEAWVTPPTYYIDPYGVPPGWSLGDRPPPPDDGTFKVVLEFEPGGLLQDHYLRFQTMIDRRQDVEVRHRCISACTLVTMVPRERLCFGALATLEFHLAMGSVSGELNYEATWGMYRRFPADIRAWIDARGGVDRMPTSRALWVLEARELWKMGYQRCR